MFKSFLLGVFGILLGLLSLIVGMVMLMNSNPAGLAVWAVGGFIAAYMKYLSRQTVRVRA